MKREQLHQQKLAKTNKVLQIIANHIWKYGYQPSLRELAALMGHTTPGYIQILLRDHFKRHSGGRHKIQSRAIEFDWQRYVTEASVSWNNHNKARQYPAPRIAAPRKPAARKLGRVSKSA